VQGRFLIGLFKNLLWGGGQTTHAGRGSTRPDSLPPNLFAQSTPSKNPVVHAQVLAINLQ